MNLFRSLMSKRTRWPMRMEGIACSHCSFRIAHTVAPRYAAASATPNKRGAGAVVLVCFFTIDSAQGQSADSVHLGFKGCTIAPWAPASCFLGPAYYPYPLRAISRLELSKQ